MRYMQLVINVQRQAQGTARRMAGTRRPGCQNLMLSVANGMCQSAVGLFLQGRCALADDVLPHVPCQVSCCLLTSVPVKYSVRACALRKGEGGVTC
jgi:hypothetical protein